MDAAGEASYRRRVSFVRSSLQVVTAAALAVAVLGAAPASARPAPERVGHHFPSSIDTTVPAGGSSMITTPTLGKDVDTLKVTIKPQRGTSAAEAEVYDQFLHTLGNLSKGKRLLVCVMMYQAVVQTLQEDGDEEDIAVYALDAAGVALLGCLQLAGLLQSAASGREMPARDVAPASALAGKGCDQIRPSLPATLTQTDSGYSLDAAGTTKKAARQKYRVGCKVKGHTFIYKIRSAKKGVPLRRVLGKSVRVGIQSPPDASTAVPVTVTFATP